MPIIPSITPDYSRTNSPILCISITTSVRRLRRLRRFLKPEISRVALCTLDFILNGQNPMVALRPTTSSEHDASSCGTQLGDPLDACPLADPAFLFSAPGALFSTEPALRLAVPDDERGHDIFIGRSPSVLEVDTR